MRFLMFIKHAENSHEVTPPKPLMDAMETFVGEGFKKGGGSWSSTVSTGPSSSAKARSERSRSCLSACRPA